MLSIRMTLALGMVTSALALVACSSDSKDSGSSSSGGSSSGGSSSGGSSSGGSDSKLKQCTAPDASSKCTQAELETYGSCIDTQCKDTFTECYGPDYEDAKFTGACADYMSCYNACECNDTACYAKCPQPSSACNTCLQKIGTCSAKCEVPACMKGSSAEHDCDDLKTCCASLTDADEKASCEESYDLAAGNKLVCNAFYGEHCK